MNPPESDSVCTVNEAIFILVIHPRFSHVPLINMCFFCSPTNLFIFNLAKMNPSHIDILYLICHMVEQAHVDTCEMYM